ncbi:MAG: D-amino-acid transaminase [Halanaerobiales bacterium]|nr:D-amino-acid transaminase [Halanaerobiales bacterium]
MGKIVYFNGEFKPYSEAHIEVYDRGYNFADGIYEVVVIFNGVPLKMEEHFIRLQQSAVALEINLPDCEKLMEDAMELIKKNNSYEVSTLYIQVTRGSEVRKHVYSDDLIPNIVMTVKEFKGHPEAYYQEGAKAITVPDERWSRCNIKTICLLPNIMAKKVAKRAGAFEAIQIRDGFVTDGTSSNVFIVKDGEIITPPATNYILNGITRQVILAEAEKIGLSTQERSVSLAELLNADEVFLTGTTTEVMPLVEIDGKVIGLGKPGSYTKKLMDHYRNLF